MGWKAETVWAHATIAAILATAALIFAWTGGFLSPGRIGGGDIADALQAATGKPFPGFRRAHAKGLCVTGRFEANGAGVALSRASLFRPGTVPVIGRFSTNAGDPAAPDASAVFQAIGLRFALPGGEEWRMAMDHTPIFIVSTVPDFVALQRASTPDPGTGKPDPAALPAFVAAHPETAAFLAYVKSAPPAGFAANSYYSIHAFRFIAGDGSAQAVRWQFEPETPSAAVAPAASATTSPDFLFEDLRNRIAAGPLRWRMIVIPANPGDPTDKATIRWTGPHRRIDVGRLVLDHAATETAGTCRDYTYDPLVLPRGVAASDDPLLPARSATYAASFRRRGIEGPRADAITLADHAGGRP